jgi:hypothetical protein
MLIDTPFIKDPTISGSTVITGSIKIQPSDLSVQPNAVYLTVDNNTGKVGKSTVISITTSGTSGTAGSSGTSATAGTSGLTGYPGSSGTSGAGSVLFTGSTYPITASRAITASYALNATGGTTTLYTGSTYPITASVAITASYALGGVGTQLYTGSTYPITASWAVSSSYALYALSGGTQLYTASTYPITASWAVSSSYALYALSGGTQLYTGSVYPITSSWGITASYALNSGNSVAVIFTSSFFKDESLSRITCSAYYSYYHLSTQNDLSIKITGSNIPSAFSVRLVNSGSASNRIRIFPYNTIEWAGVASGFDNTGSILMAGNQELFFSFIFYNDTSIGRPVSRSIAFITDLKTPGLQNKTTAQNLYIVGEGLSGMVSGSINDPNTYIFSADGGGIEPSVSGLGGKAFWGWMPVYVAGYGRKFLPLYE